VRVVSRAAEDLFALARQGRLSNADQHELALILRSSAEARLLFRAGQGFDRASAVQPGDEELAERLASRAVARSRDLSARRLRPRPMLGIVIGVLAGTTVAAAGWTIAQRAAGPATPEPPAPSAAKSVASQPSPRSRARPARGARSRLDVAAAATDPAGARPFVAFADVPAQASAPAPRRHEIPGPLTPVADEDPSADCSSLFAAANSARRGGALPHAVELYQTLESNCPRSSEAHEARLTLGMIELEQGSADRALSDFDGYLARGNHSALTAEALWGKARALRQLARSGEERMTLEALIAAEPRSPYADAARKRLEQLGPR
jgi:hypothetical protein